MGKIFDDPADLRAEVATLLKEQDWNVTALNVAKYIVDVYGKGGELLTSYVTYNNWTIEGYFLIVWDIDQLRHAYALPENTEHVRTAYSGRDAELKSLQEEPNDADGVGDVTHVGDSLEEETEVGSGDLDEHIGSGAPEETSNRSEDGETDGEESTSDEEAGRDDNDGGPSGDVGESVHSSAA